MRVLCLYVVAMDETRPAADIKPHYALTASIWAVVTVLTLIGIKGYAYYISGSAAILATLTDSLTDAASSLMLFAALHYSLRPADRSHRHGHGKMEGIASLFQAAFMAGAGIFLLFEGLRRIAEPQMVTHHMTGIVVASVTIVLSLILVGVQSYCLRHAPSLAVSADRAHYKTDIALNATVIASLLISYWNGPGWVDPFCAFLIAGYFGWTARKIALEATDMLMDKELPEAVRTRIKEIIKRHPDILGFHDLRTRKSGMIIHITFDVEIDPALPLKQAHDLTRALEHDILADYPYAEIIIHKDPFGDTHDTRHQEGVLH